MVSKKSPKANLESKRTISLLLGFVVVLSIIYISFEWSTKEVVTYLPADTEYIPEDIPDMPITAEKVTPPPPPPPKVVIYDEIIEKENDDPVDDPFILPGEDFDEPVDIPIYIAPTEDDSDIVVPFLPQGDMPKFIGNLFEYMSKNIKYPQVAAINDIQGRVICQFIVNKDGSISDVVVVKSIDPLLDKEAVRVIEGMPKWEPGVQNGKPVRVKYTLPVAFRLN